MQVFLLTCLRAKWVCWRKEWRKDDSIILNVDFFINVFYVFDICGWTILLNLSYCMNYYDAFLELNSHCVYELVLYGTDLREDPS